MTWFLGDAAATEQLARDLVSVLPQDMAGWTLLLEGDLGAGKSTFARALIRSMGHGGAIPSPTYTLVEPYDLPGGLIYHIDLYRVSSQDELHFLGFSELGDGFLLVEWPDRAPGLAESCDLRLGLEYCESGRQATVAGVSERGRALVAKLSNLRDTQSEG